MKSIYRYLITLASGIVLGILVLLLEHCFTETDTKEIMRFLCDATFIPGMIFICIGLLCFADKGGTFDMLAYGVRRFFSVFKRDLTDVKFRTFYDYRKAMQEREIHYAFFIAAGVTYILISLIFLYFYYYL